ncbi:Transposase [Kroppenstedtia eburnea]|uniref:Transposase n=1 Tax=Kroppenstedtia eburnea TaxID=714067 RepID=A0A1N7MV18_9BACL|nr:Transposase [Kroppenstedtia eburnea]
MQWIQSLLSKYGKTEVLFGLEPTGHYWLPLAQFLRKQGIQVALVNPMHVKKSKELDDNSPTKNDVKDARVITQLVKDGRYPEPNLSTEREEITLRWDKFWREIEQYSLLHNKS